MAAALENMNPNQHQGGSPTGADALPASFSPAKPSFLDPMAMLMAAKNEGNSEVDERAARALEQQLELQGRHEIEQVRLALQIQSEEDEALLQAAKQEEEDLLAAQLELLECVGGGACEHDDTHLPDARAQEEAALPHQCEHEACVPVGLVKRRGAPAV